MNDLIRGLRFTFRGMLRRPIFSAVVILTLALGLGVNTAIFSFVSAILLEPLPFPEADRLVRIESVRGGEKGVISMQEIEDFRENLERFEGIAGYSLGSSYNLSGSDGPPETLTALLSTGNIFEVLGVPMHLGGSWPAKYDRERNYSVVLSYQVWQDQFNADPDILDRTLTLDAASLYEVFGVLPPGFDYPVGSALFRSAAFKDITKQGRNDRYYIGLARLSPGATLQQAQEELDHFGRYLTETYPDTNEGLEFELTPLKEVFTGAVKPYLLLLFAAAALVLLVVCCNVVSLLLARGLEREQELATRSALGAGRGYLLKLQVIEALVLSIIGGALGLLGASLFVRLLARFIPVQLPIWMDVAVDGQVLVFTVLVTLVVGLLAGLWPAWRVTRSDLAGYLKQGGRGSSAGQGMVQKSLVVAEVALAVVLSIGAGLMLQSFDRLQSVDPGYHSDDLLTYRVALSWRAYRRSESNTFFDPLLEKLEALPGVAGAAMNSSLPLTDKEQPRSFTLEGQTLTEQRENPYIHLNRVSPNYFEVMQIPLVEGRLFDSALDQQRDNDDLEAMRAVIVSRDLANRLWPNDEPLQKRLKIGEIDSEDPWLTVVGVVGDVLRDHRTQESSPDLYISTEQTPWRNTFVALRTEAPPLTLAQQAGQIVWDVDPEQSFNDMMTMNERLDRQIWQMKISRMLFLLFAALTTVLAAVGIFGVISYRVEQQSREIGIRMAVGSGRRQIVGLVMSATLRLVGVGVGVGLVAALVGSRVINSFLYGVGALDPATFAAVPVLLAFIALIAGWLPALRAAHIDPIKVLRAE